MSDSRKNKNNKSSTSNILKKLQEKTPTPNIAEESAATQKKNPFLPSEYNRRDIIGLQGLSKWSKREEQINLDHNRILQSGFMHRKAHEVLSDARLAGAEWITQIYCPTIEAAILLHIAKEMVVNYQVKEEELNIYAHSVYDNYLKLSFNAIKNFNEIIEKQLNNKMDINGSLNEGALLTLAMKLIGDKVSKPRPDQIEAAKRLVVDIERRKILFELVSSSIKSFLTGHESPMNLVAKSSHEIGATEDYCFLGAAGSGKSTISKLYFNADQKANCIVLATDNYRAFTLPGSEAHEEKVTKDVFTRTHHIAFIIKELVINEIDSKINNQHKRPNLICDCMTLDNKMRNLLSQGKLTSVVAAYRGEPGYFGIAERVEKRALNDDAAPSDKGRFVETTTLLKGHADTSQRLLTSIPQNTMTTVYDTSVEQGTMPIKIATIDSGKNIVEINDLRVMSEFLNKQNINVNAVNQIDLILKKDSLQLATHPEYKAKSVLDLIPKAQNKPEYTVKLKNGDVVYAELKSNDDKIDLTILDMELFMKKTSAETIEAPVLRSLTRQVIEGDIKSSFNAEQADGDKNSFLTSLSKHKQFEKTIVLDEKDEKNELQIRPYK